MRALVTGGAGFIGSHIAERLLGEGHAVRIYDNFSSGKRANVDVLGRDARLEVIEADVRDAAALDRAAEGCDVVFHEAAVVSVPYSVAHPQETHDVNIQGTLNVLQAARARAAFGAWSSRARRRSTAKSRRSRRRRRWRPRP